MKACIIRQARELAVEDTAEPSPAPHEVVIQLGAGGICGSDLHYFAEGGVGDFKLREPMILGHESAGTVARAGAEVKALKVGDRVAVDPSQPCGHCATCQSGRRNLCPNVRFFGSAARYPHIQGIFADFFAIRAENCHVIPDHLSFRAAACAEPLAVGLHAVGQAGAVLGKSVVVLGSGPIGVLLAAAAKLGGAERICVIDLLDEPLAIARAMGATETINAKTEPDRIALHAAHRGTFDVSLEASGNAAGLANALELTRPGGTIVQVGNYPRGDVAAPLNRIIAKELQFHGSFRFDREYASAVHALRSGRIDVTPLLTHEFPFSEVQDGVRDGPRTAAGR